MKKWGEVLLIIGAIIFVFGPPIGWLCTYPWDKNVAPYVMPTDKPMGWTFFVPWRGIMFKNYECHGDVIVVHGYWYTDWFAYHYTPADYIYTIPLTTKKPLTKPECFPDEVGFRSD